MCTVCGCDPAINNEHSNNVSSNEFTSEHEHHNHHHNHNHNHHHNNQGLHYGQGEAGATVAGFSQNKLVQIERNILSKNNGYAENNRQWLDSNCLLALNLVSSPGAGKTTLLVETLKSLKHQIPVTVIEGDQQTDNDADRIRQIDVPAIQINTGKGCHLDAHMIGHVAVLGDQAKDEEFKALLWNTSKFLFDTMSTGYNDKLAHMMTEGGVN